MWRPKSRLSFSLSIKLWIWQIWMGGKLRLKITVTYIQVLLFIEIVKIRFSKFHHKATVNHLQRKTSIIILKLTSRSHNTCKLNWRAVSTLENSMLRRALREIKIGISLQNHSTLTKVQWLFWMEATRVKIWCLLWDCKLLKASLLIILWKTSWKRKWEQTNLLTSCHQVNGRIIM
jgi:hypothetical protein